MFPLSDKLINAIVSRGRLYEVGGSVRDSLLDNNPENKDRDFLVTGIPMNDLMAMLRPFGKVDLVGKSFGVLKFCPSGWREAIDIAIPRTERSTGQAHRDFEVTYDPHLPIEIDLRRRDFTINAMAREIPSGEIIDPYNGRKDIADRQIRIVFPEAIIEDALRILRGAQFAARFEFDIEPDTLDAMKNGAHLIDTISPERIAEELNKMLLKADKPSIGFHLLQKIGVLERFLPELSNAVGVEQPGGYHRWDVFNHTMVCLDAAPKKLNIRLAALFHDLGKPATRELVEGGATFYGHDKLSASIAVNAMRRLRYSNDLIDEVEILVSRHMFTDKAGDKGIRRLIKNVGQELIFDLIEIRRADITAQGMGQDPSEVDEFAEKIKAELDKKSPFGLKDLQISGNDIMKIFELSPGPLIGDILDDLLEMVLDNPETNTRELLLARATNFLSKK